VIAWEPTGSSNDQDERGLETGRFQPMRRAGMGSATIGLDS
jgi:hypothetical protein